MSKITECARGEICQIQIPGICNGDPATTVWCHSNALRHGKGVGIKSHVIFGSFGCSSCHDVYDGRLPVPAGISKEEIDARFRLGHERSLIKLLAKGLVICK